MTDAARYRFFVDESGHLHESSVHESLTRLFEVFPEIEPRSMEAEIMLERCHRLLALERDAQWAPLGLTGSRFILLRQLYVAPDKRLNMGQIAAQMNLEPNNVTQIIAALVQQGLVRKEQDVTDKRVVYANLTPEGEALFERTMRDNAERIRHAFAVLEERERQTLTHLLTKVRMHLLADATRVQQDHPSDSNRLTSRSRGRKPAAGRDAVEHEDS